MINTDLIGDIEINGYADLLNPELKGKIVFADPQASSSSFEHLVNMLYAMGTDGQPNGWDYVREFCKQLPNGCVNSSSAVYKGVADGEYAVGLTFEQGAATYVSQGNIKVVYMEAVSYTHLDVYKRQAINRPAPATAAGISTQGFQWLTTRYISMHRPHRLSAAVKLGCWVRTYSRPPSMMPNWLSKNGTVITSPRSAAITPSQQTAVITAVSTAAMRSSARRPFSSSSMAAKGNARP